MYIISTPFKNQIPFHSEQMLNASQVEVPHLIQKDIQANVTVWMTVDGGAI